MTTITKERIELFIKNPLENGLTRGEQMELARIALVVLTAEPVAWMCEDEEGREYNSSNEFSCGRFGVPLYAAPPAPVSVPDGLKQAVEFYEQVKQENIPVETGAWKDAVNWVLDEACRAAMLQGAEPVSQTYKLPELIEGMEVSIDVSTCDADAGNRYFGTVTEVSELYTAKNGYILLVQDAEPNFDVNGNSPVIPEDLHRAAMLQDNQRDLSQPVGPQVAEYEKIMLQAGNSPVSPDGWISCSERMPAQDDWVLIYSKYGEYLAGQVQGEYVELNDGTLSWLGAALHWMPLPEPPEPDQN
ncbi:TPA: DUF551 domain-containing protein [Salmonella enterica subsp. enterica serovar Kottbus]